jgi:MFS transporter, DHA1 family, chloramphenicol resistance protein
MPFAVYVLGLAVFAQGTSEFMLSGLVQAMAADLGVSIPAVAWLTSAFAIGMIVGAPLAALLRWPRRLALLVFLSTFLVVHVIGAITANFEVLLVTRVIAALSNAGFLAFALATAVSLASARGRATAVLLSGVTLACIVGVPLGAVLSEIWGWRATFWGVAVLSAPALIAILRSVPASPVAMGTRERLRWTPRLTIVLLLGALVNGATFCTYTFLAPMVTEASGLVSEWVPVALALFGIGSFAGVTIAGRLADRQPVQVLVVGGSVLLAGWVLFALTAGNPVVALLLVFVQGTLSFGVGSTLIAQALDPSAPTLAGGFATAAFNVGAALGPALGGATLSFGSRSPLWVSAALVTAALTLGALTWRSVRTVRPQIQLSTTDQ